MPAVCFVCLGNICRSPMADAILAHLIRERGLDGWSSDSCGTGAWHVGNRCDPRTAAVLSRHGIAYDGRARQLAKGDYGRFDILIAMDEANLADIRQRAPANASARWCLLGEYDPEHPGSEVPDPYYGGDDGFDRVYEQVSRSCEALIAAEG